MKKEEKKNNPGIPPICPSGRATSCLSSFFFSGLARRATSGLSSRRPSGLFGGLARPPVLFFLLAGVVLLSFLSPASAQLTYSEQKLTTLPGTSPFASTWFKDANGFLLRLPIIMAALALAIVALAYMAGMFLQSEELKQFSKEELIQAGMSLLMIGILLGTVVFLDQMLENTSNSIVPPCPPGYSYGSSTPRMVQYAGCYIDSLYTMSATQARGTLIEAVDAGESAYRYVGYQSDDQSLAYSGANYRPNAYRRLDLEVKGQELNQLSTILFSLGAQRIFLMQIIPALAPVLILLGFVLRILFFTRKLGGLLIAVGFGLFMVFPATYLLSWVTLQVSVFGPQAIATGQTNPACPVECKVLPPLAYNLSANPAGAYQSATMLDNTAFRSLLDQINVKESRANKPIIGLGDEAALQDKSAGPGSPGHLAAEDFHLQTCFPQYKDAPGKTAQAAQNEQMPNSPVKFTDSQNCPLECRFIPTPTDAQCNQTACDRLPLACRLVRGMGMLNYTTYAYDNAAYCEQGVSQNGQSVPAACPQSACPDICKSNVQEVKTASFPSTLPSSPSVAGVIPSANGGKCDVVSSSDNTLDPCHSCPAYCRQYYSDVSGNPPVFKTPDCNNDACKACLSKTDPSVSPPLDCAKGVPIVAYSECDDSAVCGHSRPLKDIAVLDSSGGITALKIPDVCPTECRVFFDDNAKAYRDPAYIKYCEGNPDDRSNPNDPYNIIAKACNRCPLACKTNASVDPLGALQTTPFSSSSGGGTTTQVSVSCSPPPQFLDPNTAQACTRADQCQMKSSFTDNCARCPLDCRFSNPSSVNDQTGDNLFKSSAHYPLTCFYLGASQTTVNGVTYPGARITYSSNAGDVNCPYDNPSSPTVDPVGSFTLPYDPPACSPAAQIFVRADSSDVRCPAFYAPSQKFFMLDSGQGDFPTSPPAGQPYIQALSLPNQDVSGECVGADIEKYCAGADGSGNAYCPSSCKVDRATSGPFMCTVDAANPYSPIPENQNRYCPACASDSGGSHSTGPQCQVLLSWAHDNTYSVYEPAGCSPSCAPGSTVLADGEIANPVMNPALASAGSCDGFCYPRLTIPSACSAYAPNILPPAEKSNRSMDSGKACPLACRYDYKTSASTTAMPGTALSSCGYDASSRLGQNCDPRCRPGLVPASLYPTCTGQSHACAFVPGAPAGVYWVRSPGNSRQYPSAPGSAQPCLANVVRNTSGTYANGQVFNPSGACTQTQLDSGDFKNSEDNAQCLHSKDWYQLDCSMPIGTFSSTQSNYRPYQCTPLHKYAGLDEMISAAGVSDYYECGNLNDPNANDNPDYNFCGSFAAHGNGGTSALISGLPDVCKAQYNARAVACMPYASYVDDMGTSTQPIPANGNCQQCPSFCRVEGGSACTDTLLVGGLGPDCAQSDCALSPTLPDQSPPSPPGFCGVKASDFHLPTATPPGTCAPYIGGAGLGCPARCRIRMPDGSLPAGCDGGDIGEACHTENLPPACQGAAGGASPCASCTQCEEDCTAKPYVRTDCASLCSPADILSGATAMTPKDLMSSYGGAEATMTSWQSIGSLYIPAVLLPIFGAIITIAFIRVLSPLLGGDVEIPGLFKLI